MDNLDTIIKNPIFWPSLIGGCVVVYFLTGNFTAVGVTLALVAVGLFVFLVISNQSLSPGDVSAAAPDGFDETTTVPGSKLQPNAGPLQEVFYVSGNKYTYKDAPAVCAAYNAELATYEQLKESYGKGAEWCGHGWVMGGMALHPVQEDVWERLEKDYYTKPKTRCGQPGINGGKFDPTRKFGVNCYGNKPEGGVPKNKKTCGKMKIQPFNRHGWSMWGMA